LNNKDENNNYYLNTNNLNQENKEIAKHFVNKIKMTRACIYLFFCCTRRRKIIQNVLIDEGMLIISEKLDVFNIFEQLYKNGKIQEKVKRREIDTIEMSDICKKKLKTLGNKLH
jgi:hypothetical protein